MDVEGNSRDSALRALQLEELAGLLEIRRVCRENGLRYYLTGGTLLGAVRHRGFIPWDDDMDIAMPREDYDRFCRLCERERVFPPEYYVQTTGTDRTYPHCFAKLRHGPLQPYALQMGKDDGFIDIFPLDPCPDGRAAAVLYFAAMRLVNNCILFHTEEGFVCGYRRRYMLALWRVLRHLPLKWLFAVRNGVFRLFARLSSGKHVCNVGGRYGYPGEVCEAAWFARPSELEFEGHRFSVPSGWDGLLTNMFGDYMTPPPVEERQGHLSDKDKTGGGI